MISPDFALLIFSETVSEVPSTDSNVISFSPISKAELIIELNPEF